VRDVKASSRWYARLLGAEQTSVTMQSDHAHLYDRLMSGPALVLQLHAWDEEDHPNLVDAKAAPPGHGVLVWFEVDDFDAAVKRARALKAKVLRKPHVNPAPQHRELWLRDPDGYVVVLASPDGEAA
jgi:catechol 2,3-dioxygenase-like lactoylglutathione lyase family enzyme